MNKVLAGWISKNLQETVTLELAKLLFFLRNIADIDIEETEVERIMWEDLGMSKILVWWISKNLQETFEIKLQPFYEISWTITSMNLKAKASSKKI